jgi:hypothetical protein
VVINKGSIESIVVKVVDEIEGITELPSPTQYDIFDTDGNPEQQNQNAVIVGMTARCLINTTALDVGDYDLFLKFTAAPESPYLGPHRFRVE